MGLNNLYNISEFKVHGNEFSASIGFDPTHEIFSGHFPGQPVVPGVCLIHIVKEIANMISEKDVFLTEGSNIKFLKVIAPGENAKLQIQGTLTPEAAEQIKITAKIFTEDSVFFKFLGRFNNESVNQ